MINSKIDESLYNNIKQSLDDYIKENLIVVKYSLSSESRSKRKLSSDDLPSYLLSESSEASNMSIYSESCRTLEDTLKHTEDTFQETVLHLIDSKGLKDSDVYNKAHIDRRLFSKLRSNKNFRPSKKTAISLCFGLELNIDDSLDLLEKASYTLSYSSKFDLIIRYFLEQKNYDLDIVNKALYDYKQDLLYY